MLQTLKFSDTEISTPEIAKAMGLSSAEYSHICQVLERKPNFAESGIFSAMFSEHCSYKSSKRALKRLPTRGSRVLQGPGENAGIIEIGEGWAIVFKMESHNHPSFIEPYQGAATGVGGILRDIFTMGARPIASMNGLCFGSPDFEKTRAVVRGVVKGIGDYGNAVGVPMVAGQTLFHPCYNQNPLVNAFALGIVRKDKIFRGEAKGVSNIVVYVGSKTGRDGVHGATMASQQFSTEREPERPTVQVGDPFTEKLLLEATLEAMNAGLIVGIQDMGAAGLTSSSFEMADRAGTGLAIDLGRIPTRETGMSAYELLLSESQERMLLVTEARHLKDLKDVFEKWDLHAESIGEVIEGNRVKMTLQGVTVVDLPVDLVTHPPPVVRPSFRPSDLQLQLFIDRNRLLSASLESKCRAVFEDINFADVSPLVEQYDSMVGNRTTSGRFDDAAVLRLREIENKSVRLAFTTDCNPRISYLWPREGGRRTIAESAINLAVCGAEAIGVTDCLNFGNPENPEVLWQFEESIEGISEACEKLRIPVVSGNVSFYNDTDAKPIYPSPMIGMVGIIEGEGKPPETSFFSHSLELALIGEREGGLGGSLLAHQWFKRECGKPGQTDLKSVERAIRFCHTLQKRRFQFTLHDISDGGLITAALESAMRSPVGGIALEISIPRDTDMDGFLFGETIPRLLAAYDPAERTAIENIANTCGLPFTIIGKTTESGDLVIWQGGAKILGLKMCLLREKWQAKWKYLFEEGTQG